MSINSNVALSKYEPFTLCVSKTTFSENHCCIHYKGKVFDINITKYFRESSDSILVDNLNCAYKLGHDECNKTHCLDY